jgi:hypothetical protein
MRNYERKEVDGECPPLVLGVQTLLAWGHTNHGRATILASLAVIVVAAITVFGLSWSGYCFEHGRFLSDTEYFDPAIDEILREKTHVVETALNGSHQFRSVRVIQYRDRADFRAKNPNCCLPRLHNVGDLGPEVDFSDKLLGRAARVVAVRYSLNYIDADGRPQSSVITSQYAVTNCGSAWNAVH